MPDNYTPGSTANLPAGAADRLRRMRGTGPTPAFFTSDLSIDEFLLVEQAGFEALGLVLGSSIYHVGFQWQKWSVSQELPVLTHAMYQARELAVTRMEEEADLLGADGVVGVRLVFKQYAMDEGVLEFQAIGTAIRHREQAGSLRTKDNRPFTSDLSGQDLWKLLQGGYRPVSLAMGACVYHIAHLSFMQALKQVGRNQEMVVYTEATYAARELALERMQAEAVERGGVGIVGARVEESNWGWGANAIEFFAVGTAVAPAGTGAVRTPLENVQKVVTFDGTA
ncbi:MAG: heavy metal-binding domain-containing protein [Gemmatimonadota bacterium]|nr:heavy metal-binding domain-containing protein [Gemmatimonadota bacterium]MDE3173281.1 heavy metal-binding domain-containing protein [Gemmatimonadota bacterium]